MSYCGILVHYKPEIFDLMVDPIKDSPVDPPGK